MGGGGGRGDGGHGGGIAGCFCHLLFIGRRGKPGFASFGLERSKMNRAPVDFRD